MIKGLDHIAINVIDRKKSDDFYSALLGLKRLNTVDLGDQEITYYRLSQECRLELIYYYTDEIRAAVGQKSRGAYRHMALATDNLDELWQRCEAWHIPIRMKPTQMEKLGCRGMLIEDPNGVEVEITEYPAL